MPECRLLDLGAHDGYLGLWVARQLRKRGVGVRVDGVELNPKAVEAARRRFARDGFEASFAVGDARQAPQLFEPGTFDAVVAFEILEHVPDMNELLSAAEAMCKPDGLVFCSTPDGCFGAGNNPHHLRALRASDLADLLRRRGRLADMLVGSDTVTVASYSPAPRKGDVAIYCGPGWETWAPHDIERRGLGGSETAAVRLAEQLSELGYVVTVYGQVESCCYRDILFSDWRKFDPTERREAVISSRIPDLFDRPVNARVRALWVHDVDCADRLTPARAESLDHVLALSAWHASHLRGRYPFAAEKVRQIRNGIELSYFEGEAPERKPRVVYCSSPDRGLDKLLELWPRIRAAVPDATLAACYSAVYDRVAEQDPRIAAHRDRCAELAAATEGVERLGSLSQPELATLLRSSLVWAHPSWNTPGDQPFHETSCIAAMEAQAAGCVAVASDWGALSETVKVGRLVGTEHWPEQMAEEIIDALIDGTTQAWAQEKGPKAMAEMGWDGVAQQIAGLIDGEAVAYDPKLAGVAR